MQVERLERPALRVYAGAPIVLLPATETELVPWTDTTQIVQILAYVENLGLANPVDTVTMYYRTGPGANPVIVPNVAAIPIGQAGEFPTLGPRPETRVTATSVLGTTARAELWGQN